MALPFYFFKRRNDMNLLNSSKIFLKRNSSTILTCIGAAGVIATSVMAVKATPKAMVLLEKTKEEKGKELTNIEKVRVAGPAYIPAAIVGASTIACIFGANALSKKTQASLMSAYALLDSSYKQYKNKVKELYGEDSDCNVRKGMAKDKYEDEKDDIHVNNEQKLFLDFYSLRYFESTERLVLKAENRVNELLKLYGRASLNDFYESLGMPTAYTGYELWWNVQKCPSVEFTHDITTMDDGLECCVISMSVEPECELD